MRNVRDLYCTVCGNFGPCVVVFVQDGPENPRVESRCINHEPHQAEYVVLAPATSWDDAFYRGVAPSWPMRPLNVHESGP